MNYERRPDTALQRLERKVEQVGWLTFCNTLVLLFILAVVSACAAEGALQPAVEEGSLTARATEACTRRMAQLAAPYKAKGITSEVKSTVLMAGGGTEVILMVTIDYGAEQVQAPVRCSVSVGGRVEEIAGLDVLPTPGKVGE